MNSNNTLSLTDKQTLVYNDVINYFDFPGKYNSYKNIDENEKVKKLVDENKKSSKNKKTEEVTNVKNKLNNEYLLIGYAGKSK